MSASILSKHATEQARVGGMVPFSSCDWPGKLAAVVFISGCPWRCGYCHNPHLLQRRHGSHDWPRLRTWLHGRRGLLDAVVFSGGEPLTEPALPAMLAEVRALGFATALHSGGAQPQRLAAVLPLLDWVALDIKTTRDAYPALTGRSGSGDRAWQSLALLQQAAIAHECRSSIHPDWHDVHTLQRLARQLAAQGVSDYAWQLLRPTPHAALAPPAADWPPRALLDEVAALFPRFTLRRG